jgi:hypothetical protein
MKRIYERIIAIIILCIPGIVAVYGWTLIREALLYSFLGQKFIWAFISGLFLFLFGISILGGFIFYRDNKRNKIQIKFIKKRD